MHIFPAHLLTLIIFLPAAGAGLVLIAREHRLVRGAAVATTLFTFAASLLLPALYDWHPPAGGHAKVYAIQNANQPDGVVQRVERKTFFRASSVRYVVGIDGLSLPLVLLTTFVSLLACVASRSVEKGSRHYFMAFLLFETTLLGIFLSLNFALFFSFYALSIVPLFVLINTWGSLKRRQAAIKFLLSMSLSVLAMLIVLLVVFHHGGNLDLVALAGGARSPFSSHIRPFNWQIALFTLTMVSALIRMPAFPFHTWHSDAQAEAPTGVSMLLSALFLPTGGYVVFRIAYPLFPEGARLLGLAVAIIGVLGILHGAFSTIVQRDFKRIGACVSMCQMGFVALGAAMMTPAGVYGATFLLLAHGISSAMLFFLLGALSDRVGYRDVTRLSGLAGVTPIHWGFLLIAALASTGTPLLCGFVGQFLVLTGTFQAAFHNLHIARADASNSSRIFILGVLACAGSIMMACSLLWAIHRMFFGVPRSESSRLPDLSRREIGILAPLVLIAFALGILPTPLYFIFTRATVQALYQFDRPSKDAVTQTLENDGDLGLNP